MHCPNCKSIVILPKEYQDGQWTKWVCIKCCHYWDTPINPSKEPTHDQGHLSHHPHRRDHRVAEGVKMSNCIKLLKNTHIQHFGRHEIDVEAVMTRCDEVNSLWWWYLADNTERTENGLTIYFGEGHSTHTHRDFLQTLDLLTPYMKCAKTLHFTAADESDDFKASFSYNFRISRRGVKEA